LGPGRDHVPLGPKTITDTPVPQLSEALIAILAGAHGVVEITTRLRSAPGVPAACGRQAWAAPSVVQDPLEAGTAAKGEPMPRAMDAIDRRHRRGSRHAYDQRLQGWDADLRGMPCGTKAAFATHGSLAHQRHRRGRQRGRVVATRDDAIVVDRLCGGTRPLTSARQPLVQATEPTLELAAGQRRRTVWRIDAGGGSVADVHGRLAHHEHVHGQDDAGTRAQSVAERVPAWVEEPRIAAPQVGGVTRAPTVSSCSVRRVAGRCRKHNGQWGVEVWIATLEPHEVIERSRPPVDRRHDPVAVLLA